MANQEIRQELRKANVRQWEVADSLGISEFTFTRWLRKELPADRKSAVLSSIHHLATQKEAYKNHSFSEL